MNVHAQNGVIRFNGPSTADVEASSLPGSNYIQMTSGPYATLLLSDQGMLEGATFLDQSLSYQRLIVGAGSQNASVSAIDIDGRLHRDNVYGCADTSCQLQGRYEIYSQYKFTDAVVLEKYDWSYKEWVVGLTDEGAAVELSKFPDSLCTPSIPSGNGYQSIHAQFLQQSSGLAFAAIDQDGFVLTQCCTEGGEEQAQFLSPPSFAGFTQVLIGISSSGQSFEGIGLQEGGDVYMWGGGYWTGHPSCIRDEIHIRSWWPICIRDTGRWHARLGLKK